jgi:hypothetical protein
VDTVTKLVGGSEEPEPEPEPEPRKVMKSMFQPFYASMNYTPYQLTSISLEQKDYMQDINNIIRQGMLTS